jgi:CMP/dCMP kinase
VSRELARRLGWALLDSGALYRLVALAAAQQQIDLRDAAGIARVAADLDFAFDTADEAECVRLGGIDVTEALRSETAGEAASRVAAIPAVREALIGRQRAFARPPGLVADGRDMGTVVFPGARLKVFLTASPAARAARRHKQLKEKGIDVSLPDLSRDIAERDRRDVGRSVAPLQPAADAHIIDSTSLTAEQVIEQIILKLERMGVAPRNG